MNTDKSILHKMKTAVTGVLCFRVLYILSIGPSAELEDLGLIGERTNRFLDTVYAPLGWLEPVDLADKFEWKVF